MNKDHLNFLFALLVFVAIVGCGICNRSDSTKKEQKDPEEKVTAETLIDEYMENEVAADDKYKNKIIEVTGIVNQVKKESAGRIVVVLRSSKAFGGVNCYLKNDYKEDAIDLRAGDKITLVGKCGGLKNRTPYLRNCSIE